MRKSLLFSMLILLVFIGCSKKNQKEIPKGPSIAAFCKTQKGYTPPASTPTFQKDEKMVKLITDAGSCKSNWDKCEARDTLKRYVSDVWMNRIKLSDAEKLNALTTSIDMLHHKNKKIAAAAVKGVINGYLYSWRNIVKNPDVLPKAYVEKMLAAVDNMDQSINMGFLIQDVAELAPAYGLTDQVFAMARKHLKTNDDLVRYATKNIFEIKNNLCELKYLEDAIKDPKDVESLSNATYALKKLIKRKQTPRHRYDLCEFSDKFMPAGAFDAKTMKSIYFSYYGKSYIDIVLLCNRQERADKIKLFTTSDDKKLKSLKEHAEKALQQLEEMKKAKKKKK